MSRVPKEGDIGRVVKYEHPELGVRELSSRDQFNITVVGVQEIDGNCVIKVAFADGGQQEYPRYSSCIKWNDPAVR